MNQLATQFNAQSAQEWAARIGACWRQSVEAILASGRLILEAKAALPHGEFRAMCRDQLPFGERTAQRLMAIAKDERLANPTHVSLLPPNWGTLYELTRLDDEALQARIADGTVCPDMERRDIAVAVKQTRRATRELLLGMKQQALPQQKFGFILEDPEWDRQVWSRDTGMDRHAANHFPVSSDDILASRPVSEIAADDSVYGLWCTDPHRGVDLLRRRGFEPKAYFVWVKDIVEIALTAEQRSAAGMGAGRVFISIGAPGNGFWNRDRDEILLIGTRGNPPCPAMGLQGESVWFAARPRDAAGKIVHSAKPECSLRWIETHFPTMPKIELNRRGPARPGWSAWGNEAEVGEFDAAKGQVYGTNHHDCGNENADEGDGSAPAQSSSPISTHILADRPALADLEHDGPPPPVQSGRMAASSPAAVAAGNSAQDDAAGLTVGAPRKGLNFLPLDGPCCARDEPPEDDAFVIPDFLRRKSSDRQGVSA